MPISPIHTTTQYISTNIAQPTQPKLRDVFNLPRSQSSPCVTYDEHSVPGPYGSGSLWLKDQDKHISIRAEWLGFNNERTELFCREPFGRRIDLTQGACPTAEAFTQPTQTGCSLTSLLSATHGLLDRVFPGAIDTKERFIRLLNNPFWFTTAECGQLFREGFSMAQLTDIANRVFATDLPTWKATAIPITELPLERIQELLLNATANQRFIANYSAATLYGLEGNLGHFAHIDAFKRGPCCNLFVHTVETANYRYVPSPWIRLDYLHEAMSRPTGSGLARGLIVLERRSDSRTIPAPPAEEALRLGDNER